VIILENISKAYRTPLGEKTVLNDISYVFGPGRSTGILGASGSGKSTLMRLIAGIDYPTKGKIKRTVRVSWPLSYIGGFHPQLSTAENIKFAARIYGEDPGGVVRFVESFAGLEDRLHAPFMSLSPAQKAGLSLGLSLAIRFDVYLVDELFLRGDLRVRQRYRDVIKQRLRDSDVIMASRKPESMFELCQDALILHEGRLMHFSKLKSAVEAYRQIVAEPA
jgi:capsular polysaccharide transport system ATP-binding protein